jgi:hypothetical protein
LQNRKVNLWSAIRINYRPHFTYKITVVYKNYIFNKNSSGPCGWLGRLYVNHKASRLTCQGRDEKLLLLFFD